MKLVPILLKEILVKMKNFTLKLLTKAQKGIRGISILFSAVNGFGGQRYASAALQLG